MPKEQEEFRDAVEAVLRVVIFENWLRFYFIVGKGEDERLFWKFRKKHEQNKKNLYPQYLPLAEGLKNMEIDFQTSQKSRLRICSCPALTARPSRKTWPRLSFPAPLSPAPDATVPTPGCKCTRISSTRASSSLTNGLIFSINGVIARVQKNSSRNFIRMGSFQKCSSLPNG